MSAQRCALHLRCSYIKLEAVRARLEVRFRESLTPSRRSDAIVTHLRRDGHLAVAALVEVDAATRSDLPRSGLTSRSRGRLQRDGICASKVRAAVIAAYQGSDTREAFEAALAQDGLSLEPGDHEGVRVVRKNGALIGALDRLVDAPRATVMMRLKERSHTVELDPETSRGKANGHETITQAENQDHVTASDQALQVWMHRLKCGLAAAEAAIEQASRRSPSPPSRKGELDLAQLVCRRTEEACRAAQKQVEQRRPEQLTGWQGLVSRAKAPFFRAQARQDASLLADAERDLERAESRKADANAELQRIAAEIAAETQAYKQRIAQEDEQARPQKREAEVRIAFYQDLRMLLEQEPWLAVENDAVLLSGVKRLRRARD